MTLRKPQDPLGCDKPLQSRFPETVLASKWFFSSRVGIRVAFVVAAVVVALIAPTAGSTRGASPGETVTVAADESIPNVPGKRLVSLIVDYLPGASSVAHHHARSAFIYAYVLSGQIRSQVDGEPVRIYRAGEAWFESPGAHHRVSENASNTEPARLLAVFIVDAADQQLTTPHAQ